MCPYVFRNAHGSERLGSVLAPAYGPLWQLSSCRMYYPTLPKVYNNISHTHTQTLNPPPTFFSFLLLLNLISFDYIRLPHRTPPSATLRCATTWLKSGGEWRRRHLSLVVMMMMTFFLFLFPFGSVWTMFTFVFQLVDSFPFFSSVLLTLHRERGERIVCLLVLWGVSLSVSTR